MLKKKKMNVISNKISSIEYYDSIVAFHFNKNKLSQAKNLKNNQLLETFFDDYRYKKNIDIKKTKHNQKIF